MANILIIDDDQDFSRSFQRIIERMGHSCDIARNIKDSFTVLGGDVPAVPVGAGWSGGQDSAGDPGGWS